MLRDVDVAHVFFVWYFVSLNMDQWSHDQQFYDQILSCARRAA